MVGTITAWVMRWRAMAARVVSASKRECMTNNSAWAKPLRMKALGDE